ncbi:hypothetical protein P8452_12256 [Trifolium repens]|nr:hypothetical protein P8452_12256 [Trifolium repens]
MAQSFTKYKNIAPSARISPSDPISFAFCCLDPSLLGIKRKMEGESKEGNSLAAVMPERIKRKMEGESIEGNSLAADMPKRIKQKIESESIEGNSLAADGPECIKRKMEGESLEENSLAAEILECFKPKMEGDGIEGNSLPTDMPEQDAKNKKVESIEGKPLRTIAEDIEFLRWVMEDNSIEGNSHVADMPEQDAKNKKVESIEGKPLRDIVEKLEFLRWVMEDNSLEGNSLVADMPEQDGKNKKVESIEGKPLRDIVEKLECFSLEEDSPIANILKDLKQLMEHAGIKLNSHAQLMEHVGRYLAGDMPEVTISIKDAEKAHSENKNKEVAKPALESQWNTHRFLKLADVHPDEFFEMEPFPVSYFQELNLLGSNDSDYLELLATLGCFNHVLLDYVNLHCYRLCYDMHYQNCKTFSKLVCGIC